MVENILRIGPVDNLVISNLGQPIPSLKSANGEPYFATGHVLFDADGNPRKIIMLSNEGKCTSFRFHNGRGEMVLVGFPNLELENSYIESLERRSANVNEPEDSPGICSSEDSGDVGLPQSTGD